MSPPAAVGDRLSCDEGILGAQANAKLVEWSCAAIAEIISRPTEHIVIVTHGFALTHVITAWLEPPCRHAGYAIFAPRSGSITTCATSNARRRLRALEHELEKNPYVTDALLTVADTRVEGR
ncbi:hypothetical protein [Mycolicibacterium komossense]|uniref:Phosphoglycerate mutase n=1 Tax=Mycolicibacterium komossense TaxID=1779 RepID=A0ABT3CF96_9MYCO|nr:hypothetical protein [Mycolicibacterium komossense]MCV7228179.1 hypothetical protein [Mycolicibacterium komossense]